MPPKAVEKVLIIAYGNEYRGDDGLGQAVLTLLDPARVPPGIVLERMTTYELTLDLAETVRDYNRVIFLDASLEGDPIHLRRLEPQDSSSPLSHHLPPEKLLYYVQFLYGQHPEAYLLSVRGYYFDFSEHLSPQAAANAWLALERLEDLLLEQ